ncbi:hypothetical protein, partial [Paenibacillus sp. SAFN-117]|uniref:hypothetical protein n=1 Tax=Paenibacillus sp. SAFN-117 TaxID=3436860 RepID=UPI003F7D166B
QKERNCIHGYFFMVRTPELGGLAESALIFVFNGLITLKTRKRCIFSGFAYGYGTIWTKGCRFAAFNYRAPHSTG